MDFPARFPVPFGLQRILSLLIQKLQRFSEAVPPLKFHQSAIHSFLLDFWEFPCLKFLEPHVLALI